MKNIIEKMMKILQDDVVRLLREIGEISDALGLRVFLVGGSVRDILLGRKSLDFDITVEGDAIKLGHALAKKLPADIVIHKHFGTCSVVAEDKLRIDLATAREETYKRPGAMPTVRFSSLKEDLARRDFTINAMAISINKDDFGALMDFFDGDKDLRFSRIRVMHDKSFIDDPTRIFRAIRFAIRLDFAIESHTLELMKSAIADKILEKVSKSRVHKEMTLINKEKNSAEMLDHLAEFGL